MSENMNSYHFTQIILQSIKETERGQSELKWVLSSSPSVEVIEKKIKRMETTIADLKETLNKISCDPTTVEHKCFSNNNENL